MAVKILTRIARCVNEAVEDAADFENITITIASTRNMTTNGVSRQIILLSIANDIKCGVRLDKHSTKAHLTWGRLVLSY